MSELETRIRDALRADEIGQDDLRQPTLRVPARGPHRWPTVLATAAAVAVVATVASVIAVIGGKGSTGPAGTHAAYAGYTWRVSGVTDRRGPIPDAASFPARIAFSDAAVSATFDGASIFGHYQTTPQGYDLSGVGAISSRLIKNHKSLRIASDVLSMFLTPNTSTGSALGRPAAVAARVRGGQLVLNANRVTLRLSRVGPSRLSPMIDAIGYRWRVEAVTDQHGQLTVPHRLNATFGFDSYGVLLAKDTVNTLMGQFGLSDDGYVIRRPVPSTLVAYAGHDPTVIRLKAAVDAMAENHAAVTATVDGETLTLRRGATTLTLHRGGRMQDNLAAQSGGSAAATPAPQTSAPSASSRGAGSTRPVRHARGAGGSHH